MDRMGISAPYPPGLAKVDSASARAKATASNLSDGVSFQDVLARQRQVGPEASETSGLCFSRHAQERLSQRDIRLDARDLERLEHAVARAEGKGSRESLILMDDLALVVNVRNRIVITAVDAASRKEGIFTGIDSVVMT